MKPTVLTDETRGALKRVSVGPGDVPLTRFPDFMIIGPQRTGTTWLYRNLRHHPRVMLPLEKETYYFSTLGDKNHHRFQFETLQDYLALFRDSPKRVIKRNYDSLRRAFTFYRPDVIGEATATYATLPVEVIREITLLNPDLKAVLMLRGPVGRAWSHIKKDFRKTDRTVADVPFSEIESYFARKGQKRLADFPGMVENWCGHLKPGHLFLGTFDELGTDAPSLLAAVCKFLEIPSSRRFFYRKHLNEKINPTAGSGIPDPIREYLETTFAAERTAYQNLLDKIKATRKGGTATAAGHQVRVTPHPAPAPPTS